MNFYVYLMPLILVIEQVLDFLHLTNRMEQMYQIGVLVCIVCAVIIVYKKGKAKEIHMKIWDYAFLFLLIWGFVCDLFAKNIEAAFYGLPGGYLNYLGCASFYIGARTMDEKQQKWLLRSITFLVTGLSLCTFITGDHDSVYWNRNYFAYLLCISLLIAANCVFYEKKTIWKLVFGAQFALQFYMMIINDTLGVYLGVIFGIVFSTILFIVREHRKWFLVLPIILLVVGITYQQSRNNWIIAYNINSLKEDTNKVVNQTEDVDQAGGERILLWKMAISEIKESPLVGLGQDGESWRYKIEAESFSHPHNEFLQYTVESGIPGGLMYVLALITLLVYGIKNLKKLNNISMIAAGAVSAYLASSFVGNMRYDTVTFFFLVLGILSGMKYKTAGETQNEPVMLVEEKTAEKKLSE